MLAVKRDTSKRLGALLLQGWVMLAENCPDCQVPLMKERKSEERLCVNCDTKFVPDRQGLRATTTANAQSAKVDSDQQQTDQNMAQDDSGLLERGEEAPNDYDPRTDPRLGPFAAVPEHQAAAACADDDGSPMARHGRPNAEAETAGHAGQAASAQGSRRDEGTGGSRAPPAPPPPTGSPGSCPSSAAGPSEDIADLLSAKMLQGWALLDKYCPRCSTVLVRSKATKRMFCVACDAWIVTEAEAQQQQQQQQQQGSLYNPQELPDGSSPNAASAAAPQEPPQPQQLLSSLAAVRETSAVTATPGSDAGQPPPLTPAAAAESAPLELRCPPPLSPSPQEQQQQQQQQEEEKQAWARWQASLCGQPKLTQSAAASGQDGGIGSGPGCSSSSSSSSSTALLLSIGQTVALKMSETQALLGRTPVADTERVRSYVALLSECLDLTAKLNGLRLQ